MNFQQQFVDDNGNATFPNPPEMALFSNPQETIVEQEDGQYAVTTFPDGSAVTGLVQKELPSNPMGPRHHEENLALYLDEGELRRIGAAIKEAVEEDIDSQQEFFEGIKRGLPLLGVDISDSQNGYGDESSGDKSSVFSPALFESLQDLLATVRCYIYKSSEMIDTQITGQSSEQAVDIAERMKDFFNYFYDYIATDSRTEAMKCAAWAFLAGSAYKKVFMSPVLNRPTADFIEMEDFIVNRDVSSHLSAARETHILKLAEGEFRIYVMKGMYRDIKVTPQDVSDGYGVIGEEVNKMDGIDTSYSSAKGYQFYESHTPYYIEGDPARTQDELPSPYIITVDSESGVPVRIVRNWEEDDSHKTKIEHFVNYSMLTSLRGQGWGLLHYAAGSAEAATNLERQIINAATRASFPGGVYQAGTRLENNIIRPKAGEFVPVFSGGQNLNQVIMPLPYRDPSPILNEVKRDLEDSIKRPSAIINQKVSEIAPRAPMGTTLAMLEQLHKVSNCILQNFYESFNKELRIMRRLIAKWLPQGKPYPFKVVGGDQVIMKEDFESGVQVMPSADPSSKNSMHRYMVGDIVVNSANENPAIHNMKNVYRYRYQNLGIPEEEIKQILLPDATEVQPPPPMDPVSTIMAITKGEPANAAVWQDHDAYMTIIDTWMQSNAQNPNIASATALRAQHEAFKYMVDTYAKLGMEPPEDPSQLTPDQQNQLAVAIAHIKQQEAQEAAAGTQPPEPPLDPARVELEAAQMEAKIAQEKNQLEFQRIELKREELQMDYQLKMQDFELKNKIQNLEAEMDAFKITHEQEIKAREQQLKEKEAMIDELQHQPSMMAPQDIQFQSEG